MMKIGIGVDQTTPPSQSSNGWQLAYAWATTLAPSIQTTQRQDASVTGLVPNAQASGNAPVVDTSSALNVNVSPTVVNAQASSGTPVVSATQSPNALVPVATSQATAGVPSVSAGTVQNTGVYYLQMDGVDDQLKTPSISFNKIVLDILTDSNQVQTNYTLIDARSGSSGLYESGFYTGFSAKLNGVSNSSNFSTFPKGSKINVELNTTNSSVYTDDVNIFSRNNNTNFLKGNIYAVKFYNGASLVASYDMSTGTVNDQSGNGNHATLTGGTWVQTQDYISSVPAAAELAEAGTPTVSATSGGGTTYLQIDGVDDYLATPSIAGITDIYMDVELNDDAGTLWNARNGNDKPEIKWDGTKFTSTNGTSHITTSETGSTDPAYNLAVTKNKKVTIHTWETTAWITSSYNFGRTGWSNSNYLNMKVYSIKLYAGATLKAYYDMSTGNVNDQSGNGNNATLTGGTWVVA
jgi:hypothetical protein